MSGVTRFAVWGSFPTDAARLESSAMGHGSDILPDRMPADESGVNHCDDSRNPRLSVYPDGATPGLHRGGSFESLSKTVPLSPLLPLGYTQALCEWLEPEIGGTQGVRRFFGFAAKVQKPAVLRRKATRFLASRFPYAGTGSTWRFPDDTAERAWLAHEMTEIGSAGATAGAGARSVLGASEDEIQAHAVELLEGRSLFTPELERGLGERGILTYASIDVLLSSLVDQGVLERTAGVRCIAYGPAPEGVWQCRRCLSRDVGLYPCPRCGLDACPQCDRCGSLGVSTACLALYHRPRSDALGCGRPRSEASRYPKGDDGAATDVGAVRVDLPRASSSGPLMNPFGAATDVGAVRVDLPFALTPHQKAISDALAGLDDDALVWAACGAGKTEVTFEAIRRTVAHGGRVLFAVPRRDVADQLGRRLGDAIQGAETVTLFGGTPLKYTQAPVVVATAHQALRFRRNFDLIIVDEVDAFPLNAEPWLLTALERSLRRSGRSALMTATPPEALRRRLDTGALTCFTLPARPHGRPLPVPEVILYPGLADADRLANEAYGHPEHRETRSDWATELHSLARRSLQQGRRVLIFVPSVRAAAQVSAALQACGTYTPWSERADHRGNADSTRKRCATLTAVHANDRRRREKVQAMEAGDIDLLVSTSMLERGVTLVGLDVIVFAADRERVYDSATLIQMAGRVGRRPEDPGGRVVFWGARESRAMSEAVAAVAELNRVAAREGILKTGVGACAGGDKF